MTFWEKLIVMFAGIWIISGIQWIGKTLSKIESKIEDIEKRLDSKSN